MCHGKYDIFASVVNSEVGLRCLFKINIRNLSVYCVVYIRATKLRILNYDESIERTDRLTNSHQVTPFTSET